MTFPPTPLYPQAIDSDKTLFVVYNTSETQISTNNLPWSQEIEINPVDSDQDEIWADNGFANISGELFYYDDVAKNSFGKIYKFKKCARNIGGKRTQFNQIGTWVRGFVIAEHHLQLVQTTLNAEEFIGINFSELKQTLDWRIRHLNAEQVCEDDHTCPDINFEFNIVSPSTDGCTSTLTNYNLEINGFFKNFKIDFGDGTSTTSEQSGTHSFPPNSKIDPIVTVSNDKCQVVQTAISRENPDEPKIAQEDETFNIDVPPAPDFPAIVIPNITIPETTLTLPQIAWPCELGLGNIPSFGPIYINIPSGSIPSFGPFPDFSPIEFGPAPSFSPIEFGEFPSFSPIEFGEAPSFSPIEFGEFPSFSPIEFGPAPSFSPIEFGPAPSFSPIEFGPAPSFSPIEFGPAPSFSPIEFGPAPSFSPIEFGPVTIPSTINVIDDVPDTIFVTGVPDFITLITDFGATITLELNGQTISVDWGEPPSPSITWGTPPTCSCTVTVACPGSGGQALAYRNQSVMNDDFNDPFLDFKIDTQDIGIPSEIKLIVPVLPDIKLIHDLPTVISVEVPEFPDIRIIGPATPLPTEIKIIQDTIIPNQIVVLSDIPQIIDLVMKDVPVIQIKIPERFPEISVVGIPTTIQVVGIPEAIEIKGYIPSEITIKPLPEDYNIPLVYKGAPIPVRFDWQTPTGEDGEDRPCFALVPCK